jgi:hypothetical protein
MAVRGIGPRTGRCRVFADRHGTIERCRSTRLLADVLAYIADRPASRLHELLVDALEDVGARSLKYLYDFGDGWEHSIRIERIADAMPGIAYPRLTEATGSCPPEDVGGPWGYRDILDAIADPNNQEYAERLQWIGGQFNPTDANVEVLAHAVHSLAKKWTRRPSSRKRT